MSEKHGLRYSLKNYRCRWYYPWSEKCWIEECWNVANIENNLNGNTNWFFKKDCCSSGTVWRVVFIICLGQVLKSGSSSSSCLSAIMRVTVKTVENWHVHKNRIKSRAAAYKATCNDHPIRKVCEYCFCKGLNILL